MKLMTIALVTAVSAGALVSPTQGPRAERAIPAVGWAPLDTADSLWRRGRIAISEEDWGEAARTFALITERFPKSAYAGDALYWQAFALQRIGGRSDLRRGVRALERQKAEYAKSATYTSGESSTLLTRMNGKLAQSGDAESAEAIADAAAKAAEAGLDAVRAVIPEVERELAGRQREISEAIREGIREGARESRREREEKSECERVIGEERVEALNALQQMRSEQAMPILEKVLARRDRCSEVLRRHAVFLVSQNRGDEAAEILVNVAKTDPDPETRQQAVFWLSETRSDRAVEVLEVILTDKNADEELKKSAVFSLAQSRTARAQKALRDYARRNDVDEESRGEVIFWLGQNRDADNAAFLRELFPTLRSEELREKVFVSLAQNRSAENSRWMLERAKDRTLDGETRKQALFWAGEGGASSKDLAEIYDAAAGDEELKNQVIFVLSQKRRDPVALDKLFDIARNEKDPELRKQAVFWLGQSGDPRAAKFIEELINKPF